MKLLFLFLCAFLVFSEASTAGVYVIVNQAMLINTIAPQLLQTFSEAVNYNITTHGLSIRLTFASSPYFGGKIDYYQQNNSLIVESTGSWIGMAYYLACNSTVCEEGSLQVQSNSSKLSFSLKAFPISSGTGFYGTGGYAEIGGATGNGTCKTIWSTCEISTDDIIAAVIDNLDDIATKQLQAGVRDEWWISSSPASVNMLDIPNTFMDFRLDCENWKIFPHSKQQPGAILPYPYGGIGYTINKVAQYPPFQPTFTLPSDFAAGITTDLNFVLSEYFFSSWAWTLWSMGSLKAHVPSYFKFHDKSTNVTLSTNNPMLIAAAPWLKNYPNYEIDINMEIEQYPEATIDVNGVHFDDVAVGVAFVIFQKGIEPQVAWTINATMNLNSYLVAVNEGQIPNPDQWGLSYSNSSVSFSDFAVESSLGTVSTTIMQDFWQQFANAYMESGAYGDLLWMIPGVDWQSNTSKLKMVFYEGFANLQAWIMI